ncbi:MAG: OmpA family protein [Ignavibacteriaceae bacterium]
MKLFALITLMLLGFAQFNLAQDLVKTPKLNSMSNVFGITGEAGLTYAFTDFKTAGINSAFKGALEYYLPSKGIGNFGLRAFGQIGSISGENSSADKFSTKITMLGGGGFYTMPIMEDIYPWLGVGVSGLWFGSSFNTVFNGDVGLKFFVAKNISLNLTSAYTFGSKDRLDGVVDGKGSDAFYTGTAGLTYYFGMGEDLDSDGDGVVDSKDVSPNTPAGVKVDEFGAPLDADGDGVPDYLDKCANTPAKVKVDANGCPLDTDGDGVPDYLDKCANTPAKVKVDAKGCPLDTDGDGVPDYLDKCANTPAKVKVDANGCPLDSDGDGVPDYLDKCANTPMGVQVDADGCPVKKETKVVIPPAEKETMVLSGDVSFETNKSKLSPKAFAALDEILITMKAHPNYKWEVGGYTDAKGSVAANKKLSQQRAQAVANYFVKKGVEKNNLKVVGYGKNNPIATNETVEGRSMNRRVEIKILSKDNK